MNKKTLALSLVFALTSSVACAKTLIIKTQTSGSNFEGQYGVDKKDKHHWVSTDGKLESTVIKTIKNKSIIGNGYTTHESKQKIQMKGDKPVIFYFIGLMSPQGQEKGTYTIFSIDEHKVIDQGTYEYDR